MRRPVMIRASSEILSVNVPLTTILTEGFKPTETTVRVDDGLAKEFSGDADPIENSMLWHHVNFRCSKITLHERLARFLGHQFGDGQVVREVVRAVLELAKNTLLDQHLHIVL